MMKVALIAKPGHVDTGIGKYVYFLERALRQAGHQVVICYPKVIFPRWLLHLCNKYLHVDLAAFYENYPLFVKYPEADIYHLSTQNFATLMLFCRPPGHTVITVHDLIPWLTRNDPEIRVYHHWADEIIDRLALLGLKFADAIITDSEYSRKALVQHQKIPNELVTTVYLGIVESADYESGVKYAN